MKSRLRKVDAAEWRAASRLIRQRLIGLPEYRAARRVGCYLSTADEAQTSRFIRACRVDGKEVFVPAYRPRAEVYQWARLDEASGLRAGPWGIREPNPPRWGTARKLDLVVVPGVAFDRQGRRLGHGKGYFDRLLAECRGFKVGLALERQLVRRAPAEAHDVILDAVVTEKGVYPRRRNVGDGVIKNTRRTRAVSRRAAGRR